MFVTRSNPCLEISLPKTEQKIRDQQKLAKHIITTLQEHGFNAIIAGGAVRDWYLGIPATDLDIFIAGKPKPEHVIALFGVGVRPLTEERYEKSGFEGFECEMRDETVQFLFHDVADPRELVPHFPVSICQAWWDGEEFWYSNWFAIGERYRALIYTDLGDFNENYLCKIEGKFPTRRSYSGIRTFFISHFRDRGARHMILDEVGQIDF